MCEHQENVRSDDRLLKVPHVYFELVFTSMDCTCAKWAHVDSSGTGRDASSGNVVAPMVLPNSLPWLL